MAPGRRRQHPHRRQLQLLAASLRTPDLVMSNWPVRQQNDANAWTRAESIALSQNRTVVNSSVIEDWFPRYTLESMEDSTRSRKETWPTAIRSPIQRSSPGWGSLRS